MNKKLICTLMAGTLLVGTVTGCGSSSEGDSSAKGTELELFSSKAENKDILQKLVDKFNETHEDVTIKITAPADAGTVLKTRMAKNDMPDIVAMGGDNNYTEVESAGMLVDLSSEDYISNIQESYLQMVYDVNKDKRRESIWRSVCNKRFRCHLITLTNSKNMALRFQKHGTNSLMYSRNFRMQVNSHFL